MNTNLLSASAMILVLSAAPFMPAEATGDERHHYAPIQSRVKINKPVLSPVEEKIEAIRNEINALRRAKTARERNQFLNSQAANLDALEAMLMGRSNITANNATDHRIMQLERRVNKMQMMIEQMQKQLAATAGQHR